MPGAPHPRFPVKFRGSCEPHAPFLKERRTRSLVQGRVQEIRGISLVFREMWDTTVPDVRLCRLSLGAKPSDLQFRGPFPEMFSQRVYSRTGNGLIAATGGREVQTGMARSGMGSEVKNFRVYRDNHRAPEFAFLRLALSVLIPVPAYIFR